MSELFLKVMNMSISASWLILAVLILRLALKSAPRWVNVLLWGIVAVRLLLPFSIESALSLIPSAETISPDIMMDPAPAVSYILEDWLIAVSVPTRQIAGAEEVEAHISSEFYREGEQYRLAEAG